jgi:hypothetical protein
MANDDTDLAIAKNFIDQVSTVDMSIPSTEASTGSIPSLTNIREISDNYITKNWVFNNSYAITFGTTDE